MRVLNRNKIVGETSKVITLGIEAKKISFVFLFFHENLGNKWNWLIKYFMTDFKYDSEDLSAVRVASRDMSNTQGSAFAGAICAIAAKLVIDAQKSTSGGSFWKRIPVRSIPTLTVVGGIG